VINPVATAATATALVFFCINYPLVRANYELTVWDGITAKALRAASETGARPTPPVATSRPGIWITNV